MKREAHWRRQKGSALIVVVGIVMIIVVVIASAIHWSANLMWNQAGLSSRETKNLERYNVDRVINAVVRRRMIENNTNFYSNLTTELNSNFTRSIRSGWSNVGFALITNLNTGMPRTWFTNTASFSVDTSRNADNPLAYFACYAHPTNTNDALDVRYRLYYWNDVSLATNTNYAAQLPSATNTHYYTNTLYMREIPSCQLPFIAIDQMEVFKNYLVLNVTNNTGVTPNLSGMAFFPYGVKEGTKEKNGYISASGSVVVPQAWTNSSDCISAVSSIMERPAMGTTWMMDPYLLPEAGATDDFNRQKYYVKAQNTGTVLQFNGQTLDVTTIPAIQVAFKYGAKRVVVNASALVSGQYYIECTNPLARQRGVVVVGAGASYPGASSVVTSGALILEGTHTGGPLLLGTSYGGVVFAHSSNGPTWNAFIVNPGRPPIVLASNDTTNNPGAASVPLTAASYLLPNAGINYDTVQIKGRASSNNVRVGFSGQNTSTPDACFFQFNANGTATPYINFQGKEIAVGSAISTGGTFDFEVTYHRSINALSLKVDTGDPQFFSLNNYLSSQEITRAVWNNTLNNGQPVKVIGRSGGGAFYTSLISDFISQANLLGGVMVGRVVSGNGMRLDITPANNMMSLGTFSDRFLLFDP
ncbi:MAG: hypothetical protein ACOY3I_02815 [Verrucomicrobiota bacterium]